MTPMIGFHWTMERPERVRRVMPPITTMAKIMAQQRSSQRPTARSLAALRTGARARLSWDMAAISLQAARRSVASPPRPQEAAPIRRAAPYLAPPLAARRRRSVQLQLAIGEAHLPGAHEPGVADADRMEAALKVALPELEEAAQHREIRADIHLLPDEALQHRREIWQVIED